MGSSDLEYDTALIRQMPVHKQQKGEEGMQTERIASCSHLSELNSPTALNFLA